RPAICSGDQQRSSPSEVVVAQTWVSAQLALPLPPDAVEEAKVISREKDTGKGALDEISGTASKCLTLDLLSVL
ncbi:MAG: hypothetical protein AB7X49_23550, partial [Geminicoccaceae bacterium]